MFVTKNDLYSKVRESDLRQIIGSDGVVVDHAIGYAVGKVRSLIPDKYDKVKIFEAVGSAREGLLVSMVVDIAIYEIVARVQPNIDLTDRRERANQAIAYLMDVRNSNLDTGWPLKTEETGTGGDEGGGSSVLHGGNSPRGSHF